MHVGCASHTQKHGGVIILMSRDELAAFSHDLLSVAVPSVKRTHSHTHSHTDCDSGQAGLVRRLRPLCLSVASALNKHAPTPPKTPSLCGNTTSCTLSSHVCENLIWREPARRAAACRLWASYWEFNLEKKVIRVLTGNQIYYRGQYVVFFMWSFFFFFLTNCISC